jgi:exodeoxyribonuclease V beta subunit
MKPAPQPFDLRSAPLEPGITVLEASAGTGKTYAIAGLFLRCVVQTGLPVENILVVTFTRAATAELRQRVRRLLTLARRVNAGGAPTVDGDAKLVAEILADSGRRTTELAALLTAALETFEQAAICTIDSFCQRVLQEHAFATGTLFDSEFVTDISEPLTGVVDDFWRRTFYGPDRAVAAQLAELAEISVEKLCQLAARSLTHPELALLPQLDDPARERTRLEAEALNQFGDAASWPADDPALADLAGRWAAALKAELLGHVRVRLTDTLERERLLTFSDLRQRLDAALQSPSAEFLIARLRQRFGVALIDEFQDTDPVQFRMFRRLFATDRHQLYLVGDPKQAIYSFRGADVFAYLTARQIAARQFTLPANWRSEARLVQAVNRIFGQGGTNGRPFVVAEIPFQPVAARGSAEKEPLVDAGERRAGLQLWYWEPAPDQSTKPVQQRHVAQVVAAEIVRLLQDAGFRGEGGATRPLRPRDVAVLVGKHTEADLIEEALRAVGLPSVRHTQQKVFATAEAAELHRVLQSLVSPGSERPLRAAATTTLLGWNASQMAEAEHQSSAWAAFARRLHGYAVRWDREGFFAMWQALLAQERVADRLLPLADGERRYTNFNQLAELLQRAASERSLGRSALADWLERQLAAEGDGAGDEALLQLERDDEAVQLVTIHASKGLEYPVVFCPFLFEPGELRLDKNSFVTFHDPQQEHRLTADLSPGAKDRESGALATGEHFAEKVRLVYVALTRARNRCYAVWGPIARQRGGFEKSPLGWLLHPPAGNVELSEALETLKEHLKPEGEPRALRPELEALCGGDPSALGLRELPAPTIGERAISTAAGITPQPARQFAGIIERDWTVTSYSALTGHRVRAPEPESVTEPLPPPVSSEAEAFRGVAAGNCLHAIFERYPLTRAAPAALDELIRAQLRQHGYPVEPLFAPVKEMVVRSLEAQLSDGADHFSLAQVPSATWRCEVPFHLPLAQVTPELLAKLAARSDRPAPWTDWTASLQQLGFAPLRGFLTGKIDLVFTHAGRFHLVDWKSNWLGSTTADYTRDRVFAEMLSAQYLLQYHLYVLALDQHLRRRVPDYDYERHFGGAHYLFVRGLDPARPELGVFSDRPPAGLVRELGAQLIFREDAA